MELELTANWDFPLVQLTQILVIPVLNQPLKIMDILELFKRLGVTASSLPWWDPWSSKIVVVFGGGQCNTWTLLYMDIFCLSSLFTFILDMAYIPGIQLTRNGWFHIYILFHICMEYLCVCVCVCVYTHVSD